MINLKNEQKKRIIQRMWAWICFALNILIVAFYLKDKKELFYGSLMLAVIVLNYGIGKINADIRKGDFSIEGVVIEYIGFFVITIMGAFKITEYLRTLSVLITIIVSSIVELMVLLILNNWSTISLFFSKKK